MLTGNLLITINLIASIFLPFGWFIWVINTDSDDSKISTNFLLSLIPVAILIFGCIYTSYKNWEPISEPYATEYIECLKDNNMINGYRSLRRGYVNENLYYQYIVKKKDGGFVANKVKASEATLYYSKDNYRVEWYKKYKKFLWFEREEKFNKIYIPEGSISDEYTVDLE